MQLVGEPSPSGQLDATDDSEACCKQAGCRDYRDAREYVNSPRQQTDDKKEQEESPRHRSAHDLRVLVGEVPGTDRLQP